MTSRNWYVLGAFSLCKYLCGHDILICDVQLSNRKFHWVLAPYSPQDRDKFMATLLKPSTQVLQDHTKRLKQMRYGIETYYKQLEVCNDGRCSFCV
jgi:hypothetical protein